MAAGGRVTIDGAVGNDLWAAGRDVRVSAPVTDNVWLAGGRVVLEPSARVGGDASIAGGTVEVHAPVGGSRSPPARSSSRARSPARCAPTRTGCGCCLAR